jgi:hypothetical protein
MAYQSGSYESIFNPSYISPDSPFKTNNEFNLAGLECAYILARTIFSLSQISPTVIRGNSYKAEEKKVGNMKEKGKN